MSTNSIIAKKIGKDKYRAIFCQCDGDLTDTGRILSRYYTKPERVDQLLELGDIYALGERLWESEKEKPGEDVTIAYARDRGEELCPAKEYPFEELFDLDTPYVYIFVKEDKAMEYLTAASEHGNTFARELLERDVQELAADWKVLAARERVAKAPCLLRRELDLPIRIVRDYLRPELTEIVIDNLPIYKRVEELLAEMPQAQDIRVTLYQGLEDIFEYHKQGEAVAGISDRQVTLPSGGYLVIDHTEAMTVIDVNSGKFSGRENLEETIMQINREAALEIARQLRLRDIGGIIVVDFIDMHTDNHKREIMNSLQQALKGDKMHPKVQDITVLNLVEITRKKSRQNLSSVLYTPCPVCNGSGRVQSRENLSLEIKRRLRTLLKRRSSSKNLLITANPWLAEWLVSKDLRAWERELACSIKVEADASLHVESFMILDNSGVDK